MITLPLLRVRLGCKFVFWAIIDRHAMTCRLKLSREHNREVQEIKTEVVWARKEARPRIRRKKDSGGGGTTWEKRKRKTEAEMDGLSSLTLALCL